MEKLTPVQPNIIEENQSLSNSSFITSEIKDEEITSYLIQSTVHEDGVVRVWEEDIILPTYEIGEEEKILFFLKRGFIREVQVPFILIR